MIARYLLILIFASQAITYMSPAWSNSGVCDLPFSGDCSAGTYANIYYLGGLPSNCQIELRCLPPHQPPTHLSLICEATGQHYACEAWPRGKDAQDFTYDWFATGSLSVSEPGPSTSPLNTVSCPPASQGGFVSVVVTSPFGLSTTHFVELSCPSSD